MTAVTQGTAGISTPAVFFRIILDRRLRPHARRCISSIFYNFFFCQYRAALAGKFNTKKSIPVSQVDHELDGLIPFAPGWIKVYLDFVGFWVRMLGFLLKRFGEGGRKEAADFLDSMAGLYRFAGELYRKNLSTTRRPFYIRRPRFLLIHLLDPHLMCIPSLHVMVVILSYTRFGRIMGKFGEGDSPLVEEFRRGALDITAAILYVKQHSVNCVAAAMYAMTCFDRTAFPPEEAEAFAARLFEAGDGGNAGLPGTGGLPRIGNTAGAAIRGHIVELYRRFLSQGAREAGPGGGWTRPLLDFLEPLRRPVLTQFSAPRKEH
ncbi:MAG: hypothetical protein LBG07_10300 [Treponema sp.]|jgi:hypothetical protein|nr:hypothetical protein [Treponema sp.]